MRSNAYRTAYSFSTPDDPFYHDIENIRQDRVTLRYPLVYIEWIAVIAARLLHHKQKVLVL